ncbi:hypothetical protein EGW08_006051, partial [Elysia chlorotica]
SEVADTERVSVGRKLQWFFSRDEDPDEDGTTTTETVEDGSDDDPIGGRTSQNEATSRERDIERRRRPAYVDLSTRSVYYLRAHYSRCDTCMEKWTSNRSLTQCPTYVNQVLEFEKWAQEFSNMLRYGCDGQGMASGSRCCHGPQTHVTDTISQMAQVSRTLTKTLRDQCSKCPVDCSWHEWSSWSQCPPPACEGSPRTYRTRTRAVDRERYGGRGCYEPHIERQEEKERKKCNSENKGVKEREKKNARERDREREIERERESA